MSPVTSTSGAAPAPWATSITSPSHRKEGKVVTRSVLHLDQIPGAMDKMGWPIAAQLMRHWFSIRPAWVMPEEVRVGRAGKQSFDPMNLLASQYDDQIVKMSWLTTFSRVGPVIKDLIENWASEAGKKILVENLMQAGWQPRQRSPFDFGRRINAARELDSVCQVNYRTVGSMLDTLDDLYGAIGMATLKIAVVGHVLWVSSVQKNFFHPEKIGIYLRDTYDFNNTGFESAVPLGMWSADRCLGKAEMAAYLSASMEVIAETYGDFVPVYNHDFRRWQRVNGTGGDFVVYSDVMWVAANMAPFALPELPENAR
jgi:hypothetical protein